VTDANDSLRRVAALVAAARRLSDPRDPLGAEARRELPETTGLSPEGVELALGRCLETRPTEGELRALVASVPHAPRAHVILSANVFTAAHRAVALALAASKDVSVRPSRREGLTARLLERGAPGLFRVVERLDPRPGDHVWAYGTGETLDSLFGELPAGVTLHAHGPGYGVVLVESLGSAAPDEMSSLARAVADDVVVFDQRGCLSPRVVFVLDDQQRTRALAEALSRAMSERATEVPLGRLSGDEIAERLRYRDAMLAAGDLLPSGEGFIGVLDAGGGIVVPPVGRNLLVARATGPERVVSGIGPMVTAVGVSGTSTFESRVAALFPLARVTRAGAMQTPPFDGAVDRRPGFEEPRDRGVEG
jgi:hypothetical protein